MKKLTIILLILLKVNSSMGQSSNRIAPSDLIKIEDLLQPHLMDIEGFMNNNSQQFTQSLQSCVSITGKWKGKDKKDLVIEIYKAPDGLFYGKNSQGKIVLQQLRYDAKSNDYKGKMTPPNKDITLNLTLIPENSEKIKLIGKNLQITKTIYLSKVK